MKVTAKTIAEHLNGSVEGDFQCEVSTLSKIEEAAPGSITFIANPKYESYLSKTKASIIIVSDSFQGTPKQQTFIRVPDPYQAFTQLLALFQTHEKKTTGIAASAVINASVVLPDDVYIGPNVVIESGATLQAGVCIHANSYVGENVRLGSQTVLYPNVVVYAGTEIGNNCIIHSGAVIGADGFGFAPQKGGQYAKIPQTGTVVIGHDVEIGANATIDRATIGATKIGNGTKIDNQVQIAHNVEIGKHTVIAAQSGVAGSSKVGDHCVIGGQVGIVGHLKIGNHVRIQGQSGVTKDVPDHTDIQGTPAMGYKDFYRSYAIFKRLPELDKDLTQIKNNKP